MEPHGFYRQYDDAFPSPRYSSTGYYSTGEAKYVTGRSRQSTPTRPHPSSSSKETPLTPSKATEADARKHDIPPGYFLDNWDPAENPILLMRSVFDANTLGKWIYKWTVYRHGYTTPISNMAAELRFLLARLSGKIKRARECMPRIQSKDNEGMLEDFMISADRLADKLKKILGECETAMLKVDKRQYEDELRKNRGVAFVESIFGRQVEDTKKFMANINLWIFRFDANCEDILDDLTIS